MKKTVFKGLEGEGVTVSKALMTAFESDLKGYAIRPGGKGYEKARALWNGMIDKKPGLIVRCHGAADVMACVNLARDNGLLLAVRGGGHNVAGNAVCDGGLVVDLTEMRSVRVDKSTDIVHIEGGALLGDVDHETYAHGLSTPMGVVSETGYAGLTLHGGMGWQMRKYGLAADNVAGVDIVTADGSLLHANSGENPDLYWAVRGGGGNFGVVTSFTSRLHPMPREVLYSVPIFPLEKAASVLRFLREYMSEAPEELVTIGVLWTVPMEPSIPAKFHGSPALFLLACYIGPPEEGEAVLKPLRTCEPTLADLTSRKRWVDAQKFLDADYPNGRRYYWKSTMVKELTDAIIDSLVEHTETRPSKLTSVDVWYMGGAFGRVGAEETAFGGRNAQYTVNYESNWDDPGEDGANIDWTRASLKKVQDISQALTYLNFAGLGEEAETMVRASFGKNYDRLKTIKASYDPDNLFRTNFNISPGKK